MYNEYNFYDDDDFDQDSNGQTPRYVESDLLEDHKNEDLGGSGRRPGKKPKKHMSTFKKFGLVASMAAVFGLVGAGVYVGATTLAGKSSQTSNVTETAVKTDAVTTGNAAGSSTTIGSTEDANKKDSAANAESQTSDASTMTVEEVSSNSMPAMVAITNKSVQDVQNYYGGQGNIFGQNSGQEQTQESTSMGSGVIIGETDDLIYIATNQHVIADATTLSAAFCDESAAEATVVGEDETNDLAVISVKKSDLSSDTLSAIKIISMGSSDDLTVGQTVIAIGNALGYGQSVSEGIVSALNRTVSGGTGVYAEGLIQTDAAINPGNSGGALLNMNGELIGINSAKYADTTVEGMGFSIPISTAQPILESLINGTDTSASAQTNSGSSSSDGSTQSTSDAYLGISCTGIDSNTAQYYGLPEGVYVSAVTSGSAAETAGLQEGDVITALGKTSVQSVDDLTNAMNQYSSGDTATLTVSRSNGSSYQSGTLSVTFGSKSSSGQKASYNQQ